MKTPDFDGQIGFRCLAADKEALIKLAENLGFKDLACLLRAVIKDLLKEQKFASSKRINALEEMRLEISKVAEILSEMRHGELNQLKVALFILGTEQTQQTSGLTLANPLQAKRITKVFPEFIQHMEQNEK